MSLLPARRDLQYLSLLGHLREDELQQPALKQQLEAVARLRGHDNLVQLRCNPLLRHNLDALLVAGQRVVGIGLDVEIQLRSEADSPQHPQRIIGKSDLSFKRCSNNFSSNIFQTFVILLRGASSTIVL